MNTKNISLSLNSTTVNTTLQQQTIAKSTSAVCH